MFKQYTFISFVVPFLMLGLPIFDVCFAVVRRVSHGQSPMQPDRGHVHHRLIDMGFSQKQAVGVLYVISAILGLSAVVLTASGAVKAMVFLLAMCAAAGIAWRVFLPNGPHDRGEETKADEGESEPAQAGERGENKDG
jgi:UDP-GlcNAc:undecaprenyl-phosphate GlcNAc-1-phosphate transferase